MEQIIVPPAEGRAVRVAVGQSLKIVSPHGQQAADFFAYNASNLDEWLSPMHTWVWTRSVRPRPGDVFLSRFRNPMAELAEDGVGGVHDMMIAACDQARYEQFGHQGHHASCSENLATAMRGLGHEVAVTPQPVNFFTNTQVDAEGRLLSPPNPVPPGGYVTIAARMDLICVVSSCPFDLAVEDWTINAPGGPTELLLEIA